MWFNFNFDVVLVQLFMIVTLNI